MLLGPVFRAELVRTARRRRYYFLRVLYGLALLFLVWTYFESLRVSLERRGGRPLLGDLAHFAKQTFVALAVLQLATILALVPALFGGVIADEKQRKTIHYLMASRLSSGEIVGDKLAARLLHVGIFILLGLPVVSLLGLFGGLPWEYVVTAYVGTLSITFFTAAQATLVSTFARRVRQGVLIAYLLQAAWLVGPILTSTFFQFVYPRTFVRIRPALEWLGAASPVSVWYLALMNTPRRFGPAVGPSFFLDPFLWMVGLQLAAGAFFLLIAVVQLRPTFRRQETSSRRLNWFSFKRGRPRWLRRPDCGADAMLWKERHFARTDVFTKLVVLPATVILSVYLIMVSGIDEWFLDALRTVMRQGFGATGHGSERFNRALIMISPFYIALWLIAVAGASASSLTIEREEDTWTSLVSTPLTGWEILRGKMLGAVWGLRGFGVLLSLIWLTTMALGALHPVGFVLGLSIVGLLTWFVAVLGTYLSLVCRTTARALTSTLAILFFLNGGYLLIVYPLLWVSRPINSFTEYYVTFGCTPWLASHFLMSYDAVAQLVKGSPTNQTFRAAIVAAFMVSSLILSGYAVAAILLTWLGVKRFDDVVGRPRLGRVDRADGT